jgi:hypothetical protein
MARETSQSNYKSLTHGGGLQQTSYNGPRYLRSKTQNFSNKKKSKSRIVNDISGDEIDSA